MASSSIDPFVPTAEMVKAALMLAEAQRVLADEHRQVSPGRCRCGLAHPCVQAQSAEAIRVYWLDRYRIEVAAGRDRLRALFDEPVDERKPFRAPARIAA